MNILISRHDKIGDFITALPLFYVVKKSYPDAKIYALVAKINIEIAKKIGFIDSVILYDKNDFWQTLKQIKKAKITVSISAFIDARLGLLLYLSGIQKRIAPATKIAQLFFNKTLKQNRSQVEKTEILYNLDLAKKLDRNIDLNFTSPLLKLEKTPNFRNQYRLGNKKIVLFHPGYGGSSEGNLSITDYLNLAKTANAIENIQVVFTFGPDDHQTQVKIQDLIPAEMMIYRPPTLLDFCHLINDSELLVSTSTGPMHLAGALNIKTISFFGNTPFASPKRWATVSAKNKQHNLIIKQCRFQDIQKILTTEVSAFK